MQPFRSVLMATCVALLPISAHALDVGENEFKWVSELADAGFEPFAVSSASKASFGMMRESEMYLCFLADNQEHQATRRDVLITSMQNDNASRMLPNIPVACVLAQ